MFTNWAKNQLTYSGIDSLGLSFCGKQTRFCISACPPSKTQEFPESTFIGFYPLESNRFVYESPRIY